LAAKTDPEVIIGKIIAVAVTPAPPPTNTADFFSFKPKNVMDHYLLHKNNWMTQEATFNNFTNFAARSHWMNNALLSVEPSAYLQLAMLSAQVGLFNPTYKDVLVAF
jgi:hypothetical protein